MTGRPTDHKNLNLTELNRQVIRGASDGKIIWQPRVTAWFRDRDFAGQAYPAPYTGMTKQEIYRFIGCSDRCYDYNQCFTTQDDPAVWHEDVRLDELTVSTVTHTPVGDLTAVNRGNLSNYGRYNVKKAVETEDELKTLIWLEERRAYSFSQERYDKLFSEIGDLGLPSQFVPRVNLQKLIVEEMGVENTMYALADFPDAVAEYCRVVNEAEKGYLRALAGSPIEYVNFGDNVHCGILPPYLFEKYVLPVYQSRCEFLHGRDKWVSAHWDGDVRALLPYARETGLDGIEALTPLPQGDVTIAEMRAALGDKMFLLDGIPAILFEDRYPVKMLRDCFEELLRAFAPKLVLGISDEMSSAGNLDRVRMVMEWVDDYNASV